MRYLTTIDFGRLVFEREFDDMCARARLPVLEKALVPGSVDNAMQAAFLVVLGGDIVGGSRVGDSKSNSGRGSGSGSG